MDIKIEGILFDKDGTLFDFNLSWGHWARSFIDDFTSKEKERRAIADAFLFNYQSSEFDPRSPIISGTSMEVYRAVESVFPDENSDLIRERIDTSTGSACMVPVCDLHKLLGDLKAQGLKLGVATNDSEAGARAGLDGQNLTPYFDYIVGADSGYGAKPDKGMCIGFCEMLGIPPQTALMVGDSVFDIVAGKSAGMITIGVLTGTASTFDLKQADYVFENISQIPSWLSS